MVANKGGEKSERTISSGQSLNKDLTLFVTDRETFVSRFGEDKQWCFPRLPITIKVIIQTLVPSRDHYSIDEGFDVELLIQQHSKGVVDLEKIGIMAFVDPQVALRPYEG